VTAEARVILAGASYRLLADVASKLASVALYVVMARKLGAAEFGVFTFALAVGALATALPQFGQDAILTREVARRRDRVHEYFADTLALKAAIGIPALGIAVGVVWATSGSGDVLLVVGLLAGAVGLEMLMRTTVAVLQAYERFALIPVVMILQRTLIAAGGIAALMLGASVVTVAAVYLGGTALALALSLVLLTRRVVRPKLAVTPSSWRPLMLAALPVGLTGVFGVVLFRLDTALLAAFEGDAVVGNYGAAFRLFEAILFIPWGVAAAAYPVFSRLGRDGPDPVGPVLAGSLKLVVTLTLPLAVGAVVLAEGVIELLYGEGFGEAPGALALLAPTIVLYAVSYVGGYLLVAQDRQRAALLLWGTVAAENLVANLVLIPRLSLDGAAIATTTSEGILALAVALLASRTVGGLPWTRVLAGPFLAGAAAAAAMLAARGSTVAAIAAGGAAYVAVLVAFERLAFPRDAAVLADFLRRRAPLAPYDASRGGEGLSP
jgi:O-antigen/teichoic acid export membrane protein